MSAAAVAAASASGNTNTGNMEVWSSESFNEDIIVFAKEVSSWLIINKFIDYSVEYSKYYYLVSLKMYC